VFVFFIRRGSHKIKHIDFQDQDHLMINEESLIEKRFLKLNNTINTRDIGGYKTADGKTVRWGCVYRSDELSRLDNTDMNLLSDMNFSEVFDLRVLSSFKEEPDILPENVKISHTPIFDHFKRGFLVAMLFNRDQIGDCFAELYLDQVRIYAVNFLPIFKSLVETDNYPILYHCKNGKDRTGVATALILMLLNVPKDTILSDYSLTNLGHEASFERYAHSIALQYRPLKIPDQDFQIMFGVEPKWLEAVIDFINDNYNSIDDFLIDEVGLSDDELIAIRNNLLE
jgi:protein-tyrosine phosphatase